MLLLDYARNEVGLPMRGFHAGHHVGMTGDAAKAEAMRAAGAHVIDASCRAPIGMARLGQWEISFMRGREYEPPTSAELEADRANELDDRERDEAARHP